jgi:hypothetical protein
MYHYKEVKMYEGIKVTCPHKNATRRKVRWGNFSYTSSNIAGSAVSTKGRLVISHKKPSEGWAWGLGSVEEASPLPSVSSASRSNGRADGHGRGVRRRRRRRKGATPTVAVVAAVATAAAMTARWMRRSAAAVVAAAQHLWWWRTIPYLVY